MKNLHRYFFILLLLLPVVAQGEDAITTDIIEISLGIGYYNFDEDRHLDDSGMVAIGLGLHFSRRWAFLLNYAASDTTKNENGVSKSVDMQKYNADLYRFFNTEKHIRPYLVAGFGQMDLISEGEDINKNMLNAGAGLYYRITPSWSVRGDARVCANTDHEYTDNALTITFGYRFNGGEKGD